MLHVAVMVGKYKSVPLFRPLKGNFHDPSGVSSWEATIKCVFWLRF